MSKRAYTPIISSQNFTMTEIASVLYVLLITELICSNDAPRAIASA